MADVQDLPMIDSGDLRLLAFSALAWSLRISMRQDADGTEIEAAAQRVLAIVGTGE